MQTPLWRQSNRNLRWIDGCYHTISKIKIACSARYFVLWTVICALMLSCMAPAMAYFRYPHLEGEAMMNYLQGTTVVYNGDYLLFQTVEPQIIDGRVMLPFRELLEYMGASVSYDETTHEISAKKADTTVQFYVGSPVVNVTSATGNKQNLTMDVKPSIQDGYTLIPVRFLAEAFGISVNWNSYSSCVVLVDLDAYFMKLQERAPSFYEFLSMPLDLPTPSTAISNLSFSSSTKEDSTGEMVSSDLHINAETESAYDGKLSASESVIDFDFTNAKRIFDLLDDKQLDVSKLQGVTFSFLQGDGAWYIKTNLLSKLSEAMPNERKLSTLVALLKDEIWIKIDFKKMLSELEDVYHTDDWATSYLVNGAESLRGKSALDLLRQTYTRDSFSMWEAEDLDEFFQFCYTFCNDSHFKLNKTGTDTYEVSYILSHEDYKKYFYPDDDDTVWETFELRASFTATDNHVIEAVNSIEFSSDYGTDFLSFLDGKVYFKMDFNQQSEGDSTHVLVNGRYRFESSEYTRFRQTTDAQFSIETKQEHSPPEKMPSPPKNSIDFLDLLDFM